MNKRHADLPVRAPSQTKRSLYQASFVLGRRAFAKIAAVEAIRLNIDVEAELLMRDDVEFDARRDALAKQVGEE